MFWLVKENHIMYKPPDAVFVEMSLSLRALVQETCIQKEMIFADFLTEFSFKLNSKDYSCGCMRIFLHSYKWTTSFGFHMTWIVIFLENSLIGFHMTLINKGDSD